MDVLLKAKEAHTFNRLSEDNKVYCAKEIGSIARTTILKYEIQDYCFEKMNTEIELDIFVIDGDDNVMELGSSNGQSVLVALNLEYTSLIATLTESSIGRQDQSFLIVDRKQFIKAIKRYFEGYNIG
jgi:hypothetical protein